MQYHNLRKNFRKIAPKIKQNHINATPYTHLLTQMNLNLT